MHRGQKAYYPQEPIEALRDKALMLLQKGVLHRSFCCNDFIKFSFSHSVLKSYTFPLRYEHVKSKFFPTSELSEWAKVHFFSL